MSEKIKQLQLIEQNVQQILQQKQELQTEQLEVNSALEELKGSQDSYKIIGNFMIKQSNERIEKELKSRREIVGLKLKALDEQEEKLREKAKTLRKDVVKDMEK